MITEIDSKNITPKKIKEELDRFVVGQDDAKKKVAIAIWHRYVRQFVDGDIAHEITPKNILMIGPTGVGKTEIVKRLSKILKAPFIKVEATKFTEVGYVGRDVESIIRDLADKAVKTLHAEHVESVSEQALDKALSIITEKISIQKDLEDEQREKYKSDILEGVYDNSEIEIDVSTSIIDVEIMAPPGMEEMTSQLQTVFQSLGGDKKKKRTILVKDALKYLQEDEAHKLIDDEDLKNQAIDAVEQLGIVFIDEIDKVCQRQEHHGSDISREGVQRDLLPLIEGCIVNTKYGPVNTEHLLFITSGAFHLSKPSDLIPELQGRLPVRVQLNPLTVDDFIAILSDTDVSLINQYVSLLKVENIDCIFHPDGIRKIAEIAWKFNEEYENIGARRLHTVMEKLLEDIFYHIDEKRDMKITIDSHFVESQLKSMIKHHDSKSFIL